MKFNECKDPDMLRSFAIFLMGRVTELYTIDEAWEEFRAERRAEIQKAIQKAEEQGLYEISEHISGSKIG